MPKILFIPDGRSFGVDKGSKLLRVALKNKVAIRFGCGACRCGTCAVRVAPLDISNDLSLPLFEPMGEPEKLLLEKMALPLDGTIRLSCQARILESDVVVDISFQDEYSPAD